jgi:hypothetical protein
VPQVVACHSPQIIAFFLVYGRLRGSNVAGGPGLYLDKAQHSVVPTHQIEFALVPRRAEVAGHDYILMLPQVEIGEFLAVAPGAEVICFGGGRQDRVEDADDGLGQESHGSSLIERLAVRCDD